MIHKASKAVFGDFAEDRFIMIAGYLDPMQKFIGDTLGNTKETPANTCFATAAYGGINNSRM